jgi:prevent-host-death family protein
MNVMTATKVKTNFGEALLSSMRQPLKIQKNGKDVAVLLSIKEYELYEMEDKIWFEIAKKAEKGGYVGTEASKKLTDSILNS